MANFIAELKRRHIYRVAAAYAVVAWVLLQLVNNVAPVLDLPFWIARAFLLLFVVGFPIALLFAWMRELPPSDSAAPMKASVTDGALIGVLVAVLVAVSYQHFAPSRSSTTEQASVAAARQASISPTGTISLAVLPFSNISGDASQDFFSDGMTEEIVTALAKIPDLRVVARGSASQFKGERKDLRAVGQALGATHLIEGSVRKAGTQVRISAQLVKADDGVNIWANAYDRELTDVFAIQEEIATAIASALRVPLGLKEGQSLVANRTSDTDSYQDYLRARALVRARGPLEPGGPLTEAAKLLEQVVARDPNYAPAWGLLGQAYAQTSIFTAAFINGSTDELRRMATESLQKAEAAAQQATRRDPNNIDGYNALAYARNFRGAFVQAEDLFKQALLLDPGNPEAVHQYSLMLATVGRLKDSLAMRLRLQAQEPFIPAFTRVTANILWMNGRHDEAIATLTALPPTANTRIRLAQVYASLGRYGEASDALRDIPSGTFLPGAGEEAVRLLRTAPAQAASLQTALSAGQLGFVYLYAGAPDRVLDFYEGLAEAGVPALANNAGYLWAVSYAPVRKTERFKAYARKVGLLDYWRQRGWPDLCRPVSADDFACD